MQYLHNPVFIAIAIYAVAVCAWAGFTAIRIAWKSCSDTVEATREKACGRGIGAWIARRLTTGKLWRLRKFLLHLVFFGVISVVGFVVFFACGLVFWPLRGYRNSYRKITKWWKKRHYVPPPPPKVAKQELVGVAIVVPYKQYLKAQQYHQQAVRNGYALESDPVHVPPEWIQVFLHASADVPREIRFKCYALSHMDELLGQCEVVTRPNLYVPFQSRSKKRRNEDLEYVKRTPSLAEFRSLVFGTS